MSIELPALPTEQRTEEKSFVVEGTTVHIVRVWDVYRDLENDDPYEQYSGERVYVDTGETTISVHVDNEQVL